jgi:hypothetical protein
MWNSLHTLAATLGLSTIVAESAIALTVIKYFGAIYLAYLGVKAILVRDYRLSKSRVTLAALTENRRIFTTALTISVLNPKEILFFLAFLPQFVDPSRGSVALHTKLRSNVVDRGDKGDKGEKILSTNATSYQYLSLLSSRFCRGSGVEAESNSRKCDRFSILSQSAVGLSQVL